MPLKFKNTFLIDWLSLSVNAQYISLIYFSDSTIPVYNCCSGTINPITYKVMQKYSLDGFNKNPLESVIRQPKPVRFVGTNTFNLFLNFWRNFLPFFIMDCAAIVSGRKPMYVQKNYDIFTASVVFVFIPKNHVSKIWNHIAFKKIFTSSYKI